MSNFDPVNPGRAFQVPFRKISEPWDGTNHGKTSWGNSENVGDLVEKPIEMNRKDGPWD
jgi:hypothetical protein